LVGNPFVQDFLKTADKAAATERRPALACGRCQGTGSETQPVSGADTSKAWPDDAAIARGDSSPQPSSPPASKQTTHKHLLPHLPAFASCFAFVQCLVQWAWSLGEVPQSPETQITPRVPPPVPLAG